MDENTKLEITLAMIFYQICAIYKASNDLLIRQLES